MKVSPGNNTASFVLNVAYISVYVCISVSLKLNSSPLLSTHLLNVVQAFVGSTFGLVTFHPYVAVFLSYNPVHTINATVIWLLSVKYHNCHCLSILAYVLSTFELLYVVPFHHIKFVSSVNIYHQLTLLTLLVTNHVSTYTVFKLVELLNIERISVTLLVSQLLKSNSVKLLQLLNIYLISVTLLVFQLLKSNHVNHCI